MARIVGIDIPDNKHIEIALTYIFGIGRSTARVICKKASVPLGTRTRDLTEEQTVQIRDIIENEYKVEGALRSEVTMNIKRLMEIGSYRGMRHKMGLAGARPAHAYERTDPQGPAQPPRIEAEKTTA